MWHGGRFSETSSRGDAAAACAHERTRTAREGLLQNLRKKKKALPSLSFLFSLSLSELPALDCEFIGFVIIAIMPALRLRLLEEFHNPACSSSSSRFSGCSPILHLPLSIIRLIRPSSVEAAAAADPSPRERFSRQLLRSIIIYSNITTHRAPTASLIYPFRRLLYTRYIRPPCVTRGDRLLFLPPRRDYRAAASEISHGIYNTHYIYERKVSCVTWRPEYTKRRRQKVFGPALHAHVCALVRRSCTALCYKLCVYYTDSGVPSDGRIKRPRCIVQYLRGKSGRLVYGVHAQHFNRKNLRKSPRVLLQV